MTVLEHLDTVANERLGGDKSRLHELFERDNLFRELQRLGRDTDWYHFVPKSFDGCFLVQSTGGYEVYKQERGSKSEYFVFDALSSAARHFFASYW